MVYSFILGFVYAGFFASSIDLSNDGFRERRLHLMITVFRYPSGLTLLLFIPRNIG